MCRLVTDMGAEGSFQKAAERMLEHHGVEVSVSAVRKIALTSGERAGDILEKEESYSDMNPPTQVTMEMDGVMVPIVTYTKSKDRRKTKKLIWKEMKVGVIQDPKHMEVKFACSLKGADHLGNKLRVQLQALAGNHIPFTHGVSDGATWIPEQGEKISGSQYHQLIDLYHFCEYLNKAFEGHTTKTIMVKRCKEEALKGELQKVVRRLKREQKKSPQHRGIVDCLRYIKNRPGQFKYEDAVKKDLPVGSGLIESTNRSLIQQRLKTAGAWWLPKNADAMGQLRTLRANGRWKELWKCAG